MATLLLLIPAASVAGFGLFGWWLQAQAYCADDPADPLENYVSDYLTHGEL